MPVMHGRERRRANGLSSMMTADDPGFVYEERQDLAARGGVPQDIYCK
jgi:hypothetical protein